jgi:hypothetical protein
MILQELIDEINTEIGYLDLTITSITTLNDLIADLEPDIIQKAAMNQFISEFYNGIENILKRICKYNKVTVPFGDDSHFKLFNLFLYSDMATLPIIFIPEIVDEFRKIRKFRHFIIHGYSFKIEWSYLKDSVANIDSVYQILKQNIYIYLNGLV